MSLAPALAKSRDYDPRPKGHINLHGDTVQVDKHLWAGATKLLIQQLIALQHAIVLTADNYTHVKAAIDAGYTEIIIPPGYHAEDFSNITINTNLVNITVIVMPTGLWTCHSGQQFIVNTANNFTLHIKGYGKYSQSRVILTQSVDQQSWFVCNNGDFSTLRRGLIIEGINLHCLSNNVAHTKMYIAYQASFQKYYDNLIQCPDAAQSCIYARYPVVGAFETEFSIVLKDNTFVGGGANCSEVITDTTTAGDIVLTVDMRDNWFEGPFKPVSDIILLRANVKGYIYRTQMDIHNDWNCILSGKIDGLFNRDNVAVVNLDFNDTCISKFECDSVGSALNINASRVSITDCKLINGSIDILGANRIDNHITGCNIANFNYNNTASANLQGNTISDAATYNIAAPLSLVGNTFKNNLTIPDNMGIAASGNIILGTPTLSTTGNFILAGNNG